MLHASETWPLTKPNLQRLQQNDRAMIRQICNVRPQDIVTTRSNELLVRLGTEDLDLILKERRVRWYGHVERSNGAVKAAFDIQVDGKHGPGRPKLTWYQLSEGLHSGSSRPSTLMTDIPGDLVWDLPCVQQASYLEGGPLVWMLPLYLHVNQNLIMMIFYYKLETKSFQMLICLLFIYGKYPKFQTFYSIIFWLKFCFLLCSCF